MPLKTFHTLGDGNCLIHAILQAAFPDYQKSEDLSSKREIAKRFRELMSKYILEPDPLYPTEESVANGIRKQFRTDNPRNFLEFLRCMYNYNSSFKFPNEKDTKQSDEEYVTYLKDFCKENDIESEIIFLEVEKVVKSRVNSFREKIEEKLGNNLYLPNKFNKGVIEAILNADESTSIPEGLYKEYHYNARIFTFCDFGTLVKIEMEYNDFNEVLFIRNFPRYFASNNFIGDADVLPLVPDIMEINIIVINFTTMELVSSYETKKSNRYVILNNDDNLHYETIGEETDSGVNYIFTKESPIIQEFLKN